MAAASTIDDAPISDVNTTPLIDVMLVLLVMIIITIPIQSHAVKIDLPTPSKFEQPVLDRNKLVVTAGGNLLWNGAAIGRDELRNLLARFTDIAQPPELQFEPDAQARYEIVDSILADIKRADVKSFGFVGNERYASF